MARGVPGRACQGQWAGDCQEPGGQLASRASVRAEASIGGIWLLREPARRVRYRDPARARRTASPALSQL